MLTDVRGMWASSEMKLRKLICKDSKYYGDWKCWPLLQRIWTSNVGKSGKNNTGRDHTWSSAYNFDLVILALGRCKLLD